MFPLTCTVSMAFQLPETPLQLLMVTRCVYRLLHTWVLFPPMSVCVCVEERPTSISPPVFQLCGSLSGISQQLCRRVGVHIIPS